MTCLPTHSLGVNRLVTGKSKMYYVYFIFAGYRVAIGRTGNLASRLSQYKRTRRDVEILGVITCETKEASKAKEREVLRLFQNDNDFRDMFFLSERMRDWVVEHTSTLSAEEWTEMKQKLLVRMRENSRNYRKNANEAQRRHHTENKGNPEYRQRRRKHRQKYYEKPDVKEHRREYQRKYYQKRKQRAKNTSASQQTSDLF